MAIFNIPYSRQEITNDDVQLVDSALHSSLLTGGEFVNKLEDDFKKYIKASYSVAVSSGTAALHLACASLNIPKGKTILVPSLTFAATINAVLYCGANIEFVDIDPDTLLMDINIIESKLKSKPNKYAGIICVDFAGYPMNMKRLRDLSDKYGLWIIEDAAHALGAVYSTNDEQCFVGSCEYADITTFSFHPVKQITTGEGGMVTTNNEELYKKIKLLRSHSMDKNSGRSKKEGWYYKIDSIGYNYRMSDINAALGISQLKRVDINLRKRIDVANKYINAFKDHNIKLPKYDIANTHAYHLFIVQIDNRLDIYNKLRDLGIYTQVHYVPLHLQPIYKLYDGADSLKFSEDYYNSCLSIPMFPSITEEEQNYIIESLLAIVN